MKRVPVFGIVRRTIPRFQRSVIFGLGGLKLPTSGIINRQVTSRNEGQTDYIGGLNNAQKKAAMLLPGHSMQILAGPGTGKTRVLEFMIADLILKHSRSPADIYVATFSRKAATELKHRLIKRIGLGPTKEIKLGTFHSNSVRHLKSYGSMLHPKVPPDFWICDDDDSLLLIKYIAESYQEGLGQKNQDIQRIITRKKTWSVVNPSVTLEDILWGATLECDPKIIQAIMDDYNSILESSHALDFTDQLVKMHGLIQNAPNAPQIRKLKHILVDEFQDTDGLQYEILKGLSKRSGAKMIVVGDADQSIYTWRGGNIRIFDRMRQDFPDAEIIYLEENYRSTEAILKVARAIISQVKSRPPTNVFTSRTPQGPKPLLKVHATSIEEANSIAIEIQRLVQEYGFRYEDIAILTRENYGRDHIIKALKNEKIPYQILSDKKKVSIFDRPEVKELLAYLRLAVNPLHTPSLIRVMRGKWGFSTESVSSLTKMSATQKRPFFQVLIDTYIRGDSGTPRQRTAARCFIGLIGELDTLIKESRPPIELIRRVLEKTDFISYLMTKDEKYSAWKLKNVQRLIDFAGGFQSSPHRGPTRMFLEKISELSEISQQIIQGVTISTSHSSKGLEWPVVFVPEVISGTYPHRKSDDIDEDIRLLYVTVTRAQCLLYLSYPKIKLTGKDFWKETSTVTSDILGGVDKSLFQEEPPRLSDEDLRLFRQILGREVARKGTT